MYVYMGRVGCLITVSISSDHKIVELDPRVRAFDTIRVKAPRSADFKVYGSGGGGRVRFTMQVFSSFETEWQNHTEMLDHSRQQHRVRTALGRT